MHDTARSWGSKAPERNRAVDTSPAAAGAETSVSESQRLRRAIDEADAIVVGAGAGLSAADGFEYAGRWFQDNFADFAAAYGFSDAYSAGFYPFPTPEEKWAYWSRYINHNRYERAPGRVYAALKGLVSTKDYFVITTNVDHCFQRAGFDKQRLFYTQGDYGLFQCSVPCHQDTYDNPALVAQMVTQQRDMRIPSALVPRCPRCGALMETNLRADDRFVQDAGWEAAARRYQEFLIRHRTGAVLYLELGVGANTPGIIKYPFWQLTANNPQATYAAVGFEAVAPREIAKKSLLIRTDIAQALGVS